MGERVSFISSPKKVREDQKLSCDVERKFSPIGNKILDLYKSRYTSPLTKPLIRGDSVFAIDDHANVLAFSLINNKPLWKRKLSVSDKDLPYGAIAYNDNMLFITYGTRSVVCLNAVTGLVIWKCDIAQRVRSKPVIVDGRVIVQSISNEVVALDEKTGRVIWSIPSSNPIPQIIQIRKMYAYKNMVLYMNNNFLNSVSIESGKMLYSQDMISNSVIDGINRVQDSNFIDSFLTADKHDESLLYVYSAGVIYALRLQENRAAVIWHSKYTPQTYISECNEAIYFIDIFNNLIAIDKSTGSTMLSVNLTNETINQQVKKGSLHWYTPIPISGGVFIVSREGHLAEYNFKSHKIIQKKDIDSRIEVEPVLVGNNAAYFVLKNHEFQITLSS